MYKDCVSFKKKALYDSPAKTNESANDALYMVYKQTYVPYI